MRLSVSWVLPLLVACGSTSADQGPGGDGADSGPSDAGGDASTGADGAPAGDAGPFHGGNPKGSCAAGVPARGKPVDTSHPTTVVGTGTAASCTFESLAAAVAKGGIVTFDCGGAPVTIPVASTLALRTSVDTVLDGGGLVTLDGRGAVRILSFDSPGWRTNTTTVTLQHIALVGGKTAPTKAIPPAPPPCSQGWDDGEGGALVMRDGNLVVIDSIFTGDQAAPLGPDTGGGAIYVAGSLRGALVASCTFTGDSGSNAGAVGTLNAQLEVYDSLVTGNVATGHDANNNDPSKCSAINNGQNEIGSGGNGGALYADGDGFDVVVCGDDIENNAAGANAFGGGIFFTSDDFSGTLSIADSTIVGNTGGHWTSVKGGSVTNAGTAVGVNAKSITITNSTVQGYP